MSTLDADRLGELVVEALERIAFVIVEPCDEADLPGPFAATQRARITISGVGEGSVWLDADDGFACELAAGLLGCDADEVDPTTTGRDALSELANIVGGSVVVALGGEDREYRLGLPEPLEAAAEGGTATPAEDEAAVRTLLAGDEGAIAVCWCPAAADAGDGGEVRAAA